MLTSCRFFQCNFSTFLSIYSPSYNCYPDFQISWLLQGYCPANTHPDPAMKLVFLAHCFEHTGSLYPLHHQFPSSLTMIFHFFPRHHLWFTVKTSVPVPAGSPPTLFPAIAHMFGFVTSIYVLIVLEEVPSRHPKCSFLILKTFLSNLFHSDTHNQLKTGKWLGCGEEIALPVVSTNTFGFLLCVSIYLYLRVNYRVYELGFCASRLLRALVSSPKHSVNTNEDSKELPMCSPPLIYFESSPLLPPSLQQHSRRSPAAPCSAGQHPPPPKASGQEFVCSLLQMC